MSRGLRNNNPGNIRLDSLRWLGEVLPSADRSFKQFSSIAWGYRAMFALLDTYRRKYGLVTVAGIVNRYAPPLENDTGSYVASVARLAGVAAYVPLDFGDRRVMQAVVGAMSLVENGVPAVMSDVEAGWDLFVKHRR